MMEYMWALFVITFPLEDLPEYAHYTSIGIYESRVACEQDKNSFENFEYYLDSIGGYVECIKVDG
tara:strand:+ start:9701 stop:9895 length:195 start_codon:yes stop_codon:yes gene_type:complete